LKRNPSFKMSYRPTNLYYMKAVIIDDEIDICLLLGMILKKQGISSLLAHNLSDGLEKVTAEQPMLIFLDNNLPDGLGIDQIANFREKVPKAKLFMISAMEGISDKAIALGADGFLEKPLNLNKIMELFKQ
jgi:two-component system, OmpR family, response regulator